MCEDEHLALCLYLCEVRVLSVIQDLVEGFIESEKENLLLKMFNLCLVLF